MAAADPSTWTTCCWNQIRGMETSFQLQQRNFGIRTSTRSFVPDRLSECLPVKDKGLVLLSCRAFMACCCFSKAANMSPKSSSTDVLLFFPAVLVNVSCRVWKVKQTGKQRVILYVTNVYTCNFFCSMLISEYSCAVAKAAANAFFLWLLALFGTEVVIGMGVCTMLIGEFSGRFSSCDEHRPKSLFI